MILPPQDTERFYRIWLALLGYTNTKLHIIRELNLSAGPTGVSISPADVDQIRQALWADDSLRENFITENPAGLPERDLNIVASWEHRVSGKFFVLRHLRRYTAFLDDGSPAQAYGVLGLVSPFEEIIGPYVPILVQAVLLPFENKITYDSLLLPYNITFGGGIRQSLQAAYRDAQEREGIITSLPPAAQPTNSNEAKQRFQSGNSRVLSAFRRELYKSGLSPKMVEQHVSNIEIFASSYLLAQDSPHRLVDIQVSDLKGYLDTEEANITSFTRFVRFLRDSGRIDPDTTREFQDVMKLYRNG